MIRKGIIRGILVSWLFAPPAFAVNMSAIRTSVFKIEVVSQTPRFNRPWLQNASTSSTGSGFYIGNNRIVTNAHVVANGKFITVQRDSDDRPIQVKVAYIAHDCDLAILEPLQKSAIKDAQPLQFGGLPRLHKPVSTVGYPRGGDQISITEGVVSRISYRRYAHTAYHDHLLVQVDSAINPGNSGGPVVQGNRVVGVAFQSYINAENTGYIIPVPVIQRFLKDVEDGRYDGHPAEGLATMASALENDATRRFHQINSKNGGVKVVHVETYSPLAGHLFPGDVLLAVDGTPIGSDGKIRFQEERVHFAVLYDLKQIGDNIKFKVVRDQQILNLSIKITKAKPHYEAAFLFPKYPKFYTFAGLVFTSLSRDYLRSSGKRWYQKAPLLLRYLHWNWQMEERFRDVEDIVIFATRLPHPINSYVEEFDEKVLLKVNGQDIRAIEDVEKAVQGSEGEYIVFEFFGPEAPMVLPRKEALEAHQDIVKKYGITPEKWFQDANEADGATGGML